MIEPKHRQFFVRLSIVLLLAMFVFHPSSADTQFTVSASLSTSTTSTQTITLLPNTSLVMNTSISLSTSNSNVDSNGSVTFYYNDSTTATMSETASQAGGTFVIVNPYPGKPVDKMVYLVERIPPQYVAYMVINDFWTRSPDVRYTIYLSDLNTAAGISGFCATFTSGSPNGTTCTSSSGTPFYDGSGSGWGGMTRYQSYERYLNSWLRQPNVTRVQNISGKPMAVIPWFTQSNYCTNSYLNTGCGITTGNRNLTDYYCIVTDELSQFCLAMSMSTNSSNEQYMQYCLNTIQYLNSSYGSLTEWAVRYDNRTGTPSIDKSYTNDNAADSDLRFIMALYNYYNNANMSNTSGKSAAKSYADTMCTDVVRYNMIQQSKTSYHNGSRTIDYWPGSGGDVVTSGLNADLPFTYSGYYGDYLLAMAACAEMTGNTTYYTIGDHIFESLLAAANWTTSTGFRTPPGRAFKWVGSTTPYASCKTICSPDYIDDPDGMRMTKVCSALAVYEEAGVTLHQDAQEYCNEWYAGFNDIDAYSNEWYKNGTRKSALQAGVTNNGLATHIDMAVNMTNAIVRANYVGSNQYNTGTETFDSASCQGIYGPGLAFESYGYLISEAFSTTMGFSGASTCTGAGSPVTYTKNGLQVKVNTPVNNSNVTGTSVLINLTLYNNNVTSTGGSTGWISSDNDTFSVDAEGWSGGDGVVSGRYNKTGTWGTIRKNFSISTSTPYNISMQFWFSDGGANDPKLFVGDDTGDDYLLLDGTKPTIAFKHIVDGGGYATGSCNAETWTDGDNITIIVNGTNWTTYHNTKYCHSVISSAITSSGGDFEIVQAESAIAIDNVKYYYYGVSGGTAQNSTVNVSIRNGLTNAQLVSFTGVENATSVSYNWSGLSTGQTYYWYANVTSLNNNERFSNFSFTTFGSTTTYDYCNTTGDRIVHAVQGNFSLLVHNITAGLSTPQYFNISIPYLNINITNGYYTDAYLETYQSVGIIGAVQLYTGNVISSFKALFGDYENTTTTGYLRIPLPAANNSILVNVSGNYTKNVSVNTTPLGTTYANATGIYDTIFYIMARFSSSGVSNFSVNFTGNITNTSSTQYLSSGNTSNGTLLFAALRGYYYTLYANATGYALNNVTIQADEQIEYYNFSLLIQNTFELYFRNETSNALLNGTKVYVELISESFSSNYSTTSGNLTISLLTPTDYTIHYWYDDQVKRDYYTTLTTSTYQNLTLYLVDSDVSTFYIPVLYDQKSRRIENATIQLLRYYVDCNCYRTVEMSKTDTNGQAVLRVVPNTINYKLLITKGSYSIQTTPAKLTSSTNPYTLSLTDNPLTSLKKIGSVSSGFSFNNATNTYVLTWTDNQGIVSGACIEIVKYKEGTQTTEYATCSDGSSGSVIYTVTDTNNSRYVGRAYLRTGTTYSNYALSEVQASFIEHEDVFGKIGVFLTLLVFLAIVFMTSEAGTAATIVGGIVSIVIMMAIGFLAMDWTSVIGIVIVAGIIVYKLRS